MAMQKPCQTENAGQGREKRPESEGDTEFVGDAGRGKRFFVAVFLTGLGKQPCPHGKTTRFFAVLTPLAARRTSPA
jgi:hypothetical protein